jgi:hypothetical protein
MMPSDAKASRPRNCKGNGPVKPHTLRGRQGHRRTARPPGPTARRASPAIRPPRRAAGLRDMHAMRRAIAVDHRQIVVLMQGWNPSHSPNRSDSETFSSTASGGVDRGRALVLDHVARHQVAAVRGGVEQHILRPALDPAIQHRLQRLVMLVVMAERQVVAEQQEPVRRAAQMRQQPLTEGRSSRDSSTIFRSAPRPAPWHGSP